MSRGANIIERKPAGDDLLIRKRVEDMLQYAYTAIRQFPKAERHVLSAEIRATCWRLQKLYAAGRTSLERIRATLQSWHAHASFAETNGLRKAVSSRWAFSRNEERTS